LAEVNKVGNTFLYHEKLAEANFEAGKVGPDAKSNIKGKKRKRCSTQKKRLKEGGGISETA